jgi:hypothetical protein
MYPSQELKEHHYAYHKLKNNPQYKKEACKKCGFHICKCQISMKQWCDRKTKEAIFNKE